MSGLGTVLWWQSLQIPLQQSEGVKLGGKEMMKYQLTKLYPQSVTPIPVKARGRPPILLDLDEKFITSIHS